MSDNLPVGEQSENPQPSRMTRRSFLRFIGITGAGALFTACDVIPQNPDLPFALEDVASPYPAAVVDDATLDNLTRFMQVSMALTGFDELSPKLAETYMQSISNADNDATLEDLYSRMDADAPLTLEQLRAAGVLEDSAFNGLISSIVKHWYTGTYQDGENTVVATYTDALAWRALDFTKPRSICGSPRFWETNPYQQP